MGLTNKLRAFKQAARNYFRTRASVKMRIPNASRRTRVYLFVYSIELLVVIIGVAAGFALNNWAEAQKEEKLVNEFLVNLKADLDTDMQNLRIGDSINNQKIEELRNLIVLLKINDREQMDTINVLVQRALQEIHFFYAANTTYESIKQGGQVNLIKDFGLKNNLIYLYEYQYAQLRIKENIILEDVRTKLEPFVTENYDMTEFQALNVENLFSYRFANLVQQLILNLSESLQYYKESLAKCEEIRKQLDQRLNTGE